MCFFLQNACCYFNSCINEFLNSVNEKVDRNDPNVWDGDYGTAQKGGPPLSALDPAHGHLHEELFADSHPPKTEVFKQLPHWTAGNGAAHAGNAAAQSQMQRQQHTSFCRLVRLKKRGGVMGARYIGATIAHPATKYLVFLDSHIEVNHFWLEPLVQFVK